jgi:excisionase family DNA binding protein
VDQRTNAYAKSIRQRPRQSTDAVVATVLSALSEQRLRINEAAREVGVHPDTVRRGIKKGALRAQLVRGRYVVRRSDLEAWAAE